MERRIAFAPGEYYHIYNRGVNKSKIFSDRHDYWRFMFLLYLSNTNDAVHIANLFQNNKGRTLLEMQRSVFEHELGEDIVSIGAFCLMPNHFHILIKEVTEGGISKFMQKLSTAYIMYFNKRHIRTGAFFEGRFRAEHVQEDTYLKYLFAYIHLNPVKLFDSKWKENGITDRTGAERFLCEYEYSSYSSYSEGKDSESKNKILNSAAFPKYFTQGSQFTQYIKDWLDYRREG